MSATIGSKSYPTYATVAEADTYLAADFNATVWRAAEADDKARAMVTSTRVLNRVLWAGDKTESDQDLAWPRTETDVDGVEDDEIPQPIIDAAIELASSIIAGTDVSNQTQAQTIKRQAAGSVSIEYFRTLTSPDRFPLAVQELIKPYLAGGTSTFAGSIATGTDSCSDFTYGYEPTGL